MTAEIHTWRGAKVETLKAMDDAEFRRWVLTLIEARDLPAHELRFISGETSALAFAKEREEHDVVGGHLRG